MLSLSRDTLCISSAVWDCMTGTVVAVGGHGAIAFETEAINGPAVTVSDATRKEFTCMFGMAAGAVIARQRGMCGLMYGNVIPIASSQVASSQARNRRCGV